MPSLESRSLVLRARVVFRPLATAVRTAARYAKLISTASYAKLISAEAGRLIQVIPLQRPIQSRTIAPEVLVEHMVNTQMHVMKKMNLHLGEKLGNRLRGQHLLNQCQ